MSLFTLLLNFLMLLQVLPVMVFADLQMGIESPAIANAINTMVWSRKNPATDKVAVTFRIAKYNGPDKPVTFGPLIALANPNSAGGVQHVSVPFSGNASIFAYNADNVAMFASDIIPLHDNVTTPSASPATASQPTPSNSLSSSSPSSPSTPNAASLGPPNSILAAMALSSVGGQSDIGTGSSAETGVPSLSGSIVTLDSSSSPLMQSSSSRQSPTAGTTIISDSPSNSSTMSSDPVLATSHSTKDITVLVGTIIGSVLFSILLFLFLLRRWKKRKEEKDHQKYVEQSALPYPFALDEKRVLQDREAQAHLFQVPSTIIVPPEPCLSPSSSMSPNSSLSPNSELQEVANELIQEIQHSNAGDVRAHFQMIMEQYRADIEMGLVGGAPPTYEDIATSRR